MAKTLEHEQPSKVTTSLLLVGQIVAVAVTFLLLAAHFYRAGHLGLCLVAVMAPLLLAIRRQWVLHVLMLLLLAGGLVWLHTLLELVRARQSFGVPWLRLAIILGAVSSLTVLVAWSLRGREISSRFRHGFSSEASIASAASFALTLLTLGVVQVKVALPMLLLERVFVGGGWVEALLLATYAAWITEKLHDARRSGRWRRRIWGLFSVVFFAQVALGLLGLELFLMKPPSLHLPIPALIAAGPLYRGEGYFMLLLFLATVVLVGPAWCSHICYIGSLDQLGADLRRKPQILPRWRHGARVTIMVVVMAAAIGLRLAGASTLVAGALALAFGLVGVGVMAFWSRRLGTMAHCTIYCPVGLLANWLGKLSPFRLRIGDGCDGCMRCRLSCRYGALDKEQIDRRRVGISCSLCGDCLASCPGGHLGYRFLGLRPAHARGLFLTLVVALHATTLALARI